MEKSIFQLPFRVLERVLFYRKSQDWNTEKIEQNQIGKLKKLLIHSGKNVPYYRELFKIINFDPNNFENLDQMKEIPLLDKETVRTRAKDLLADNAGKLGITWDSTSGSTGTPLHFALSDDAQANKIAALLRSFGWAGYRIGMKTFCVQSYYFDNDDFRFNRLYNILRFDSNRLSKDSSIKVMQEVNRIKPKFYMGFPFDLLMLAKFASEEGINIHSPKSIVSYGETLSKSKKEQLEEYYKCKVYNYFSMHEGSAMISECEKGNLHLIEDFAFHEVTEDNGKSKLVGTNLYNFSMPLIRYNIKDNIIPLEKTDCGCGKKFRLIKEIQGKACDYIQTADGRILGAVMSHSIDNAKGVICSQIIQNQLNGIDVNVVVDETYNENSQNVLEFGLRKRLGNEMIIEFNIVDRLEKRPSGKTPFILSKIGNKYN